MARSAASEAGQTAVRRHRGLGMYRVGRSRAGAFGNFLMLCLVGAFMALPLV